MCISLRGELSVLTREKKRGRNGSCFIQDSMALSVLVLVNAKSIASKDSVPQSTVKINFAPSLISILKDSSDGP